MEIYAKIEPAGEFATGIVTNEEMPNPTLYDIENLQCEEPRENDVVRAFGLPVYFNCDEDYLEAAKEVILDDWFIGMPEDGRDKINWNITVQKPTRFAGRNAEGEEDESLFKDDVCIEKTFTFHSTSKCSVDMDFGEDVDLSKLSISLTFCEFHNDYFPDDIGSMWVLTNIDYEDSDLEFEMADRGFETAGMIETYEDAPEHLE
jgi:hypothetical protein